MEFATFRYLHYNIVQLRSLEYIKWIKRLPQMANKGFKVVNVPMGNVNHQLFLKEHSRACQLEFSLWHR